MINSEKRNYINGNHPDDCICVFCKTNGWHHRTCICHVCAPIYKMIDLLSPRNLAKLLVCVERMSSRDRDEFRNLIKR